MDLRKSLREHNICESTKFCGAHLAPRRNFTCFSNPSRDRNAYAFTVGARITWSAGGIRRSRLKNNGGSYLSSHDQREVLGIGREAKLDWLEVRWPAPSGRTERLTDLPIDRYITDR
jgi:hypothetical protein